MALRLFLLLTLRAAAVTVDELAQWFESSQGFDLMKSNANTLAQQEAPILTQCDVNIKDLTNMKNVLYSTSLLDFPMTYIKQNLLPIVKQHMNPNELAKMYSILYNTRDVDLMRSRAQQESINLMQAYAEADQVQALYQTLYSMSSVNLPRSQAQDKALELGKLGCDPVALTNSFKAAQGSTDQRLKDASDSAIRANLNGEEFQDYYRDSWRQEWGNGPPEMKMARDGKAYTASQYRIYFGANWEAEWHAAGPATQQRIAEDGKVYTVAEFVQYYKDDWQSKWRAAPELPCKECHTTSTVVV
eukprot:Skav218217  [mRNA]  locus=scaffold1375:84550:85669:- [translate_table: standard]